MKSTILAALVASPLLAADWPEFRGPGGAGLAEGRAPTEWSAKTAAWKADIPGAGWSSPVIVAGKIYLTSAVPGKDNAHSLRALCLDAKDGKILWDNEIFEQPAGVLRIHGKNSHASPTPFVADGKVYVHFGHMGTAALDLRGKILWKSVQKYSPVHGNGGSPVLVDGKLVFACDGGSKPYVVALDAKDGVEAWKTPRQGDPSKKFSFGTPLVIEVKGKKQVVLPGSDQVSGFDPADGKAIWTVSYEGYSVIPRPVFGHGLIFLSTGYDNASLFAVKPEGTGDITEKAVAWKSRKAAPHTPSPLLVGGELYTVSDAGVATCYDAKTGEAHWTERLNAPFSASPIHADGKVYFQSEDGKGFVVKAGKKFEQLAKNDMKERTLASCAVSDGALYLRTEKHLYRFDAK